MKSSYKKMIAGCIALLVVLAASGCGAGESEPVLDDVEAKQGDVVSDMADSPGALMEKPKETEPKEAAQMDASAYGEILERFYTIISNPYEDYDDVPGGMGVSEAARNTGDSALDAIGYIIEDISGDGVPELMIGTQPEYGQMVNAVYTLVDGKPQFVFAGWYRNMYVYCGDGIFYNSGSGSASESCIGRFSITQDGTALECQEFLFTHLDEDSGDIQVYYNTTGSWDPAESEDADMSEEEFWMRELPAGALTLTPFSAFGSEKAAVMVQWLEEAGNLAEYDECSIAFGKDGLSYIVFIPEHPVEEFCVLSLTVADVSESGDIEFEAYTETPALDGRLERPLVVELSFAGDIPQYGFQYEDENGDLRRFAIEVSGRDGSLVVREADRECFGFVLRGGSETEAEHDRIPVLTPGYLPFDDMESVVSEDHNPDGGYYYEDMTNGGTAVVIHCAYVSMSEEAEVDLEDYIASCAESLSAYETRDFSIEKNETYTENLSWAGYPVYIVQFTTGWNEDTRIWRVYATEANGYIYLYAFNLWAEEAWELEDRVWEVFDEMTFSD